MNKTKVNEEEYARLINNKMKEHSEYKEGMRVETTPQGTNRPSGLHTEGGIDANGIVAWAQNKIDEEYELVVSR